MTVLVSCLVATAGLLAGPPLVEHQSSDCHAGIYSFPLGSHDGEERVSLSRRPMCFECGQRTVTHVHPTTGATTTLHAYAGLHTVLLVPPPGQFSGETEFSQQQIWTFLDRLDLAYEYFVDLFGLTPLRRDCSYRPEDCEFIDDYMRVSLVDCIDTEGQIFFGCAGLNDNYISVKDAISTALAAGVDEDAISRTVYHELTHSFDSLRGYHYFFDHQHAWTRFLEHYLPYYHKKDSIRVSANRDPFLAFPDPTFAGPLRNIIKPFLRLDGYFQSSLTWDACVTGGSADFDCRDAWAGLTTFFTLIHGPEAFRRAFDFLHANAASNVTLSSAEEKSELFVKALSAGAEENISCLLDEWKWRLPQELRQELEAQYGESECIDVQAMIAQIIDRGPDNIAFIGSRRPETLPWGFTEPAQVNGREITFTAVTEDLSALVDILREPLAPTHVRFWVSGVGFVGQVPYEEVATYTWQVPVEVPRGSYAYRAQLMHGTRVISGETPMNPFSITAPPVCVSGPSTACLLGARFQVKGTMKDFDSPPKEFETRVMTFATGRAETDQAAFFESFNPGNFEIGVKMVDGCALPDTHPLRAYWLFLGGLTTAETLIEVEDTVTGHVYAWTNSRGDLPAALGDTSAFPCIEGTPNCNSDPDTACLIGDRFRVTGSMRDFSSPPQSFTVSVMSFAAGRAESTQAVFFESFGPGNFEVGVKMVDGCTLPEGHPLRYYWVFYGGLTNAETEIRVTQVSTGMVDNWTNPRGALPRSEARTSAFPCE